MSVADCCGFGDCGQGGAAAQRGALRVVSAVSRVEPQRVARRVAGDRLQRHQARNGFGKEQIQRNAALIQGSADFFTSDPVGVPIVQPSLNGHRADNESRDNSHRNLQIPAHRLRGQPIGSPGPGISVAIFGGLLCLPAPTVFHINTGLFLPHTTLGADYATTLIVGHNTL